MRKIYLIVLLAMMTIIALSSCNTKKEETMKKYLVLYYSQTGVTKTVAEAIQQSLGADIEIVEAEEPYNGDYDQTIERSRQERENGITPKVKPLNVNLDDYDVIFLGYPVWFGTYALPIAGLIKDNDFSGKKIIPFCTFGSGGLESSVAMLRDSIPNAEIADGYGVRASRISAMPQELDRFLKEQGFIEGEVEPLEDFSEQQPVTDEEKAIFDAAVGDYKMVSATPVTVGKRSISTGTEYKYEAKGIMGDRSEAPLTIYVIVGNEPDVKPDFTRIVR
ncbi:MAG: hypothetical protein LUD48_06270 [Prevotella sp.]|nr:hypothetical protein [Prevotella sp.]